MVNKQQPACPMRLINRFVVSFNRERVTKRRHVSTFILPNASTTRNEVATKATSVRSFVPKTITKATTKEDTGESMSIDIKISERSNVTITKSVAGPLLPNTCKSMDCGFVSRHQPRKVQGSRSYSRSKHTIVHSFNGSSRHCQKPCVNPLFFVLCTFQLVSLLRCTTWVICGQIHTLTRTCSPFSLAHTSQRTPRTSALSRFKVGLGSHSIKSSDADLLYLSATATTSTTTNWYSIVIVRLLAGGRRLQTRRQACYFSALHPFATIYEGPDENSDAQQLVPTITKHLITIWFTC